MACRLSGSNRKPRQNEKSRRFMGETESGIPTGETGIRSSTGKQVKLLWSQRWLTNPNSRTTRLEQQNKVRVQQESKSGFSRRK
jgi:hypothetical protein